MVQVYMPRRHHSVWREKRPVRLISVLKYQRKQWELGSSFVSDSQTAIKDLFETEELRSSHQRK